MVIAWLDPAEQDMDVGAKRAALERKIKQLTQRIDDLEQFITMMSDKGLTRTDVDLLYAVGGSPRTPRRVPSLN
jgi:molecular chaperone DnaK (HSP70)